jgi:ribosome-associated toxin RatA of RatAB toxin-antitoxin module
MAPVSSSTQFEIKATPAEVMAAIVAVEDLPLWSTPHREVQIESRHEDGRPHRVKMTVSMLGISETQIVEYSWEGDNVVRWNLIEGSQQKIQEGSYVLSPSGAGTKVQFDLTVELKMPLPGFMVKKGQKMAVDVASKGLSKFVESRAK